MGTPCKTYSPMKGFSLCSTLRSYHKQYQWSNKHTITNNINSVIQTKRRRLTLSVYYIERQIICIRIIMGYLTSHWMAHSMDQLAGLMDHQIRHMPCKLLGHPIGQIMWYSIWPANHNVKWWILNWKFKLEAWNGRGQGAKFLVIIIHDTLIHLLFDSEMCIFTKYEA